MKKIMLALAAVACLSVPALADEDGAGPVKMPAESVAPVEYVGHHDGCDHGGRFHEKFADRKDWGHDFHGRKFDRDGNGRW